MLQVPCFDTAFRHGHSAVVDHYAIPERYYVEGGVVFDADGNAQGKSLISRPESRVAFLVVPTDEELIIAQHTLALLPQQRTRRIAGESLAT